MKNDIQRGDTVFDRSPNDRSLGLVLKITERCNLACTYCYFFFGGDESYKINSPIMGRDVVAGIVEFIEQAVAKYDLKLLQITLHGGEPLLMKKPEFSAMCAAFRGAAIGGCKLRILIQTNGALVDDGWIDLFTEHRVTVGVSFDGRKDEHDIHRVDKKGRGTYDKTLAGWEKLQSAAASRKISSPGILCVVNPDLSGRELYEHFAITLGARFINFLLPDICHDDNPTKAFIAGCSQFMRDVFRAWAAHDPKGVNVRFIAEIYQSMLKDAYAEARAARGNDVTQLMIVRSTGEITAVDKLSTVDPRFNTTGRNIRNTSLQEILDGDQWLEIRNACETLPTGCRGCTWRRICRGGPINTRFSKVGGFDNPSIYCETLQEIFTTVARGLVAAGVPWQDIERRLAGPASDVAKRVEREVAA